MTAPRCESVELPRPVTFLLEPPEGVPDPAELAINAKAVVEPSGTLSAVTLSTEPCALCDTATTPGLRLAVTTSEGELWTLVILHDRLLETWKDAAEASLGQSVTLRVGFARGFQWPGSRGFVLRDPSGILLAAEAGPFRPTLEADALAPLDVTQGADICRAVSSCGSHMSTELVFHGDTSVVVGYRSDDEFELGGRTYGANNSDGGYLLPSSCSDQEFSSTWAVWRKPEP